MNFLYSFGTKMYLKVKNNPIFRKIASLLVILCYILKKKNSMSKIQAKKLSQKFVPFLFIAITILTAFGPNPGTWA